MTNATNEQHILVSIPEGFDAALALQLGVFFQTLVNKLDDKAKQGRAGWHLPSFAGQCRQHLINHVFKGDPVDVAAYAAFLHYHNEPTYRSGDTIEMPTPLQDDLPGIPEPAAPIPSTQQVTPIGFDDSAEQRDKERAREQAMRDSLATIRNWINDQLSCSELPVRALVVAGYTQEEGVQLLVSGDATLCNQLIHAAKTRVETAGG